MTKKRCPNCRKYNQTDNALKVNISYFCGIDCATSYAFKNKEKGKQIKHKQQKKEYTENKLSTRKEAAKKACHEYIRLRDKNSPCICCGKPLGDNYHAGHFLESGNNPLIRYDEDNIHAQRVDCNYFKGGDSGDYKENLIKKIGVERVNALLEKKGGSIKRTAQDYREIEKYYKDKIKAINI